MTAEEYFRKRWGGKSYKEAHGYGVEPAESALYGIMNGYARHIAEQAVKEENEFWLGDSSGLINRTCNNILIRIKTLTEIKK